MTFKQITDLSLSKKGIYNKTYIDEKGNKYIGTKDGRIVKILLKTSDLSNDLEYLDDKIETLTVEVNTLTTQVNSIGVIDTTEQDVLNALVIDFMNTFKYAQNTSYSVFGYTGENLTSQTIYTDNTLGTTLFTVTYSYTGDNITQIVIVRESDSSTYTKNLTYDVNGNIVSKELV